MQEILNIDQVAELLHAEVSTISGYACRGELPATTIGRGYVFFRDDVLKFLRDRIDQDTAERRAKRDPANIMAIAMQNTKNSIPGRRRRVPPPLPQVA